VLADTDSTRGVAASSGQDSNDTHLPAANVPCTSLDADSLRCLVSAATRLHDVAVSDSGFLFDPCTGLTFTTNPVGRFLLERLKAGDSPESLPGALARAYEVGLGDDPARDAREFVSLLREQGLVPGEGEGAS
jgi:hypothetical protein